MATDGSEKAVDASVYAVELAKCLGAEIIALHVVSDHEVSYTAFDVGHPPPGETHLGEMQVTRARFTGWHHDEDHEKASERLRDAQGKGLDYVQEVVEKANSAGVKVGSKCCVMGDAALQIINSAKEENSDLIVMGFSGTSNPEKNTLGRVAAKVVQNTPCPILIVR